MGLKNQITLKMQWNTHLLPKLIIKTRNSIMILLLNRNNWMNIPSHIFHLLRIQCPLSINLPTLITSVILPATVLQTTTLLITVFQTTILLITVLHTTTLLITVLHTTVLHILVLHTATLHIIPTQWTLIPITPYFPLHIRITQIRILPFSIQTQEPSSFPKELST